MDPTMQAYARALQGQLPQQQPTWQAMISNAARAAEDWAQQNPDLLRTAVSSSETGALPGAAGTMAAGLARRLGGAVAGAGLQAARSAPWQQYPQPENMGYVGL